MMCFVLLAIRGGGGGGKGEPDPACTPARVSVFRSFLPAVSVAVLVTHPHIHTQRNESLCVPCTNRVDQRKKKIVLFPFYEGRRGSSKTFEQADNGGGLNSQRFDDLQYMGKKISERSQDVGKRDAKRDGPGRHKAWRF
jgi:hypothetical protein